MCTKTQLHEQVRDQKTPRDTIKGLDDNNKSGEKKPTGVARNNTRVTQKERNFCHNPIDRLCHNDGNHNNQQGNVPVYE